MTTNPSFPTNLNISIDSPPITKLIETIGNGMGSAFEPWKFQRLEEKKNKARIDCLLPISLNEH